MNCFRVALALVSGCAGTEVSPPPKPPPVSAPAAPPPQPGNAPGGDRALHKIALGSCLDQSRPVDILDAVVAAAPDVFVWVGDNVYADADTVPQLRTAYERLGRAGPYARLAASVPQLAVWDDHDYGLNDSGREYALKQESKAIMLDFFGEPAQSSRRRREGNYDATVIGPPGKRVQFLLLDTRWFRDPLVEDPSSARRYRPTADRSTTVLGEAQWRWLEAQLMQPAEVRLLVSSIQLLEGGHGYEGWWLFPHERERMFELLSKTGATGVVVLTGDRHRAELSCAMVPGMQYPLVELTASSLNRPLRGYEDNRFRVVDTPLLDVPNFGTITIAWGEPPMLTLRLHDGAGTDRLSRSIALSALQPHSESDGGFDCEKFEL